MAEQELQMEEGGKKGKMMIIIIAAVILIGGGVGAFFMFSGDDEPMPAMEQSSQGGQEPVSGDAAGSARLGTALYVAMPRPFVFNVPGTGRERLVEIKVQLLVRGTDNEEKAKMHIPLIEGTLLKVFSGANADDLVTEAGKTIIRDQSEREVKKALLEVTDSEIVDQVLFTGFVMQ
jgi:flagellar protein FliL